MVEWMEGKLNTFPADLADECTQIAADSIKLFAFICAHLRGPHQRDLREPFI